MLQKNRGKIKKKALQEKNESLEKVIKELQEEVQSTTSILDQAKVKLQEYKEQTKQLTLENEELKKKMEYIDMEQSTFIEKVRKLENQNAHRFQLDGHELAALTQDSFNDILNQLNEMNCKTEQLDQAKVTLQECKEQKNQLTLENEELKKKIENFGMEDSTFIAKIQKLEKQHALQLNLAGHALAVLTQDSFSDLIMELNEMNRKCSEQQEHQTKLVESKNALKKSCEEKEAKIVIVTEIYEEIKSSNQKYQNKIRDLEANRERMKSTWTEGEKLRLELDAKCDELRNDLDAKSTEFEKSKKEISSLKGIITKNKNKTNEFEKNLDNIFNQISDKQTGEKSFLSLQTHSSECNSLGTVVHWTVSTD